MNPSEENSIFSASGSGDSAAAAEFEATLRMIAKLPAPEGLEMRVQAGLRSARASSNGRVLEWPRAQRSEASRFGSSLLRSAAAAAIAAVIVGGSWGVYWRVQSIQPARAITVPLHLSTQRGFSSAGAMRTPQTLSGPMVEHPAVTLPVTAAPLTATSAVQPEAQPKRTAVNPAKTAASKAIVVPAAPPEK